MRVFMIWFVISTLSSSIGFEALRRANIPVSNTVMDRFELLILLFPGCSVVYALLSSLLLEVESSGIEDSSIYKDIVKDLEDTAIKRLSILAIGAAVSQYFVFSFDNIWIFSLLRGAWILMGDVKPDLSIPSSRSMFFWLLNSPFLFFPQSFICCMIPLVPCLHLLVAAPYFKTLISTSPMAVHAYEQRRYVEIVCGMLANALTANYLKFQSEHLLLAFMSFAIASLGIFTKVEPSTDFGIIQFLVTSSIQCAVSLFELLHVYTFVVLLVGFGVMVLRWKMKPGPKIWGKKLWPYLIKTEEAVAYMSPIAVILPVFFFRESGNIKHFVLLSLTAVYFTVLRRKFPFLAYSTGVEIYASFWGLKWWNVTGYNTNLIFYIHFRDILHQFLQHVSLHKWRPSPNSSTLLAV